MKQNQKNPPLVGVVCILAVLASLAVWLLLNKIVLQKESTIVHTKEELQARHDSLLAHAAPTNVHPYLRPIRFRIGESAGALGTLILNKDGSPFQIVTANHLFSETQPGSEYYDYAIITPKGYGEFGHISHVVLDSMRKSSSSDGIEDIAFAHIGTPAPISRTSKVRVSANVAFKSRIRAGKISPVKVKYLVTGQQFEIIGQLVNDEGVATWVMLYESINGESGGGFWSDEGKLYILSGTAVATPQLRKDLGIPRTFRYITVLSAVELSW